MEYLGKGLYEMRKQDKDQMPCSPDKIHIWYWALPDTLGRAELEEVAARILFFSQEAGEWIGVNRSAILTQVQEERDMCNRKESNYQDSLYRQQRYKTALEKYRLLCYYTFGLWQRFVEEPINPGIIEIPDTPISIVPCYGLNVITQGINLLLDQELLRVESDTFGERVFFPTPLLITRIMQVQKIA